MAVGWGEVVEKGRAMSMTRKVERVLQGEDGFLLAPREIAERVG